MCEYIDEFREEVVHDLSDQNTIREVASDVLLGTSQGNLIHPVVDGVEFLLRERLVQHKKIS